MSWFFGGGGNSNDDKKDDNNHASVDSFSGSTTNFDSAPSTTFGTDLGSGSSSGLGRSPGGAADLAQLQEQLMAEQQRVVIQAVIMKLTDSAFENCVSKPSSSLSYSEKSCIDATVGKFLDTTELIVSRFHEQE